MFFPLLFSFCLLFLANLAQMRGTMLFPDEGTRLALECPVQIKTGERQQIRWYRNGQSLGRHSPKFSIPSLSRSDSGLYRCFAFVDDFGGVFSPAVNISVQYLDGFEANKLEGVKFVPNVSFWLKAPRLNAGGNFPSFKWKWSKQGKELHSDGIHHFVNAEGDLLILDPDEGAEGEYSVQVENGKKTKSSGGIYRVEKDSSNLLASNAPSLLIMQRPQHAKAFPESPMEIHFDCVPNLGTKFEIEIKWFINSEELPEGGSSIVRMEMAGRRMEILDLEALLGRGTRSAVVSCKVKGMAEDGRQFGEQADARLDILEIPHINRELVEEKIEKEEGEKLDILCRVDKGWPPPKISWFFKDQMIEGAYLDKLNISKLNARQFGVYQCEAANSAGSDIMPIWVRKRGNSEGMENVPKTSENDEQRKLIEKGPTNQSHLIGSNVQMNCRVRSGFRPIWFINNEKVPAGGDISRRISIDGNGAILRIGQVGPENIGEYRCTIEGDGGKGGESQSGWLSIVEKPGMVENVRAELVNETDEKGGGGGLERIRVNWTQGFDGNSPNLPVVKWVLEMRTQGPGGRWSEWEESTEMFPATEKPLDCCATFMENVRPAATAQFRVLAHNRFGAGKPSAPSQQITMPQQPPAAAPSKVHVLARSPKSIMVDWQAPPEGDSGEEGGKGIRGYLVRYRLSGYSTADWNEKRVEDARARSLRIEPLITWREYDIQVAAFNDRGLGAFSPTVSISTMEGIPMQAPQNVQIVVLNSTAILLSFDPPNPQMVPGIIEGYKIQIWKGGQILRTERISNLIGRLQKEIGNLAKFCLYNATVLCYTHPGDGPLSEPMEFRTAEDLPGPVENLEIVEVFSESAIVQWEGPKEENGEIQKYKLEWGKMDDLEGKNAGGMEISGHSKNHTLEGLEAQTKYKISIQAFTRVGPGPKVEAAFDSGVPPELPERPSGLSISEVGARKARLHFMPGADGHARIKKWILEAQIGPSSIFVPFAQFPSLPRGSNSILIESLSPHTQYQLRLIAENVRGQSLPSDPSPPFRTQQSVPEHSPHRLWADPISAAQISVFWTPLLGWEWNGDEPRAYLLQYRGFSLAKEDQVGNGTLEGAFDALKWEEIRIVGPQQHQHLLSGLRPFSLYELRILAENGMGRSEIGQNRVQIWTFEAIPSAAPLAHSELTAQGGIEIGWEELEPEMRNGQIIGYKVILAEKMGQGEGETVLAEMEIPLNGRRSIQFQATILHPNSVYSVGVQAETIIGPGPKQEMDKMLRTPEDVPDPPSNASFTFKSPSELQLGWAHPHRPKGRILHYGVLYWLQGEPRPAIPFTEIPSNLVKFSATQLRPNSIYSFALKAQTSAGWGPERVLTVKTNRHSAPLPVPPSPIRDSSRAQSATELHLFWGISDGDDHSPPRSIELQWQMANQDAWNGLDEFISASAKIHTLARLRPNSAYRVRIRFIGDLSHSVWSSPSDWLRTMEAAPSLAPSNVLIQPFHPNKLRIRWPSLPKDQWNADRIGYRVQYRIYEPPSAFLNPLSNASFSLEEFSLADHFDENIQLELDGLQSFRHYLVQIRAFNVLGQSPPSRPPSIVFVGLLKPTNRVSNLQMAALSSTSIRVHWDPLEGMPSSDGANLEGFRIRWTQMGQNGDGPEEMTLGQENGHILTELRKWSQYRISVSAFNRAGEGPLATAIGRTLEDLPGPVGQIQFRDILLDSVKVSWTHPAETNGNLTGFVVLYRTSRQRNGDGGPLVLEKIFPKKEVQMRTGNSELVLDQLDENVTYFVGIRAETAAGLGPERSAEVTIGPSEKGPEAPSRPQLIPEHREVKIRWRKGQQGSGGPIIGHLVQAKRIGTAVGESRQMEAKKRNRRALEGSKWPRHIIGLWSTVGVVEGDKEEWRIGYRELEPSSFYVFRIFARNEFGIGRSSADSEQFHVPASIPDEPFYTEWWFLALVGAILALTIFGFVAILFMTGNRKEGNEEGQMEKKRKGKRAKEGKGKGKEAAAFDTLQLSDGGIVSYELYTKRGERGDELLFSRPNTKQSWVGSVRDSPAVSSSRSNGAIGGIYGSIDGEKGTMQGQMPNVYSALCTDSILGRNEEINGRGEKPPQNGGIPHSPNGGIPHSPSYYQLRQFNGAASNNGGGGIYYEEENNCGEGGLPLMRGPVGGDADLASHYQQQHSEMRTTWRKTREKAQREQWQQNRQPGIPLSGNIALRAKTPTALFRPAEENCWMGQRRSRSSEPMESPMGAEMETDFEGIGPSFPTGPNQSQRSSNEFGGLSSFV